MANNNVPSMTLNGASRYAIFPTRNVSSSLPVPPSQRSLEFNDVGPIRGNVASKSALEVKDNLSLAPGQR